jgi:hypothetical protein
MERKKEFTIFQLPNKYLWAMIVTWPIYTFISSWISAAAQSVFMIAAIIWSYEEIIHGVNWFRKLLGVVVMVLMLTSLFRIIAA